MRKALLVAAVFIATPALAQANPQIDYPAFQTLTASVAPQRATRLLKFDAFKAEAAKPGTPSSTRARRTPLPRATSRAR